MRQIIAKALRAFSSVNFQIRSTLRQLIVRLKYPDCKIGKGVEVGRNVRFLVSDGGSVAIGDGVSLKDNCLIVAKRGQLVIGKNSFIGWGSIICANQSVTIGEDCLIAEFVTIRDQNHGSDRRQGPFRNQPMDTDTVEIGDNVWVGAKASVLAGATISHDSVVAAHGVVTSHFDPGVVVGGVPASVIKILPQQIA